MKIIINADDLGSSKIKNDAIYNLIEHRKIKSATRMANGIAFDDAVERSFPYSYCSFGAHLSLTEFAPLSASDVFAKYMLLDENGSFNDNIYRVSPNAELIGAIYTEWDSQIQRLVVAGIKVSHLDSHHHVHMIPWLLPVLKNLMKSYNIRKVRDIGYCSRRYYIRHKLWQLSLQHGVKAVMTNGFSPFAAFWENKPSFRGLRSIELMCHPGHGSYEDETKLISTDWAEDLHDVRVISYDEL